jgi:hypothetical protein
MMKTAIIATCVALLMTTTALASGHNSGFTRGSGTSTSTTTDTTVTQTMGRSNTAPPNERAAASRGVTTTTTTTTTTETTTRDAFGPPGQVNNFVSGASDTCSNCTINQDETTTETTVDVDVAGPGNR